MKRTPLKRGDSQLTRSELKRGVSVLTRSGLTKSKTKRQSRYDAQFERMKSTIRARSRGKCESPYVAVTLCDDPDVVASFLTWHSSHCAGVAQHVHHRKYRSRGGTNSFANLVDVSLACHDWIHAHGGAGKEANVLRLALSADEDETWKDLPF